MLYLYHVVSNDKRVTVSAVVADVDGDKACEQVNRSLLRESREVDCTYTVLGTGTNIQKPCIVVFNLTSNVAGTMFAVSLNTSPLDVDKLSMLIADTPLKARTKNCLAAGDVFTVKDLVSKTEKQVRKFINIGNLTMVEINEYLRSIGFTFKQEED